MIKLFILIPHKTALIKNLPSQSHVEIMEEYHNIIIGSSASN